MSGYNRPLSMGVAQFVKAAMASSLDTFDAEDVTINGETRRGVVSNNGAEMEIGSGGDNTERSLSVTFPANAFTKTPKSGRFVMCRGEKWQIATVDANPSTLRITLEEPERRGA